MLLSTCKIRTSCENRFIQDPDQAPSREELLQSHLKNWTSVRRNWRMASHKNEERYAASKEILTKMFER